MASLRAITARHHCATSLRDITARHQRAPALPDNAAMPLPATAAPLPAPSGAPAGAPFDLAFPVDDLDRARRFFGGRLGCAEGRSSAAWIDVNFFGPPIVAHLAPPLPLGAGAQPAAGHRAPPVRRRRAGLGRRPPGA